ncbi:MAG TPA: DUF4118 domain-containing protein [Acidimicrobiia bacterium]|nr:DUF4118 domain-containing protein [Acidimicrobiia bacterium]
MEPTLHGPEAAAGLGWSGLASAVLGPVAIAAALIPVRGDLQASSIALVLVLTVVLAATIGGRSGGAISALVAAVSFDFLFTRPYYSFSISNGHDVETVVLLLAVGLAVGEIVARSRRSRAVAQRRSRENEYLRHVAELGAGGESPGRLVTIVRSELVKILDLESCRFERPPFQTALPQLRHRGVRLETEPPDEVGLHNQLELPVRAGGRVVGRFVLTMRTDGTGLRLPTANRAFAVALADQLGAALPETEVEPT